MEWLQYLEKIDKALFLLIHTDSDHGVLDNVVPILRDPITWIPLYAFMLFFAIFKTEKKCWLFILLSLTTFALTDLISFQLLKPLFQRPRPCHDPELAPYIRHIIDCGGLYSMPSSHASNHFGLAAFWYWSLYVITGKKWKWLFIWAAIVCYAQVYVGKHYPMDILVGAALGYMTGTAMARVFELGWNKLFILEKISYPSVKS